MKSNHTLYLIRGVPGSGKSTFAKTLLDTGVVLAHFEANMAFYDKDGNYNFNPALLSKAHDGCQNATRHVLSKGYSVAVSNTSTTEEEVETYRHIARKAEANFVSIIVENRHQGQNLHGVPEDKIQKIKNRFSIKL